MIENILKSPVLTDPWRHQVINNFFDEEDFLKIWKASYVLHKKYENKTITSDGCLSLAEVADDIGDDVFNIILKSNKEILDNIEQISKNYPNHYKHTDYISFPSFHLLPPNTDYQKIHDESSDKTISVVLYLYPEKSTGTLLYKENNRDSLAKEIPWNPNTAMLFCGEDKTTWHDFCSREFPRVTINYFVRSIPDRNLKENDDNYYWTFGNGMKSYIPKSISKEKLNILTSGILFRKI